ncbi:MAG: response regulator transcription factor, partial [Salinivenus sp.]
MSDPESPNQILLALDHQPSADLLSDRLERAGATAIHVPDGAAAREALEDTPPDVLVAAARLPGRTGLELLRELPGLRPPVVLIGRRGNDDEVVRAFELGAADYITRPFSPRVAVARIRRCLQFGPAPSEPQAA